MATELASLLIGGAIGLSALAALTLNLLVLFVLAQEHFLTSRSGAFYILAFVNIISDSTRTACFAFYLAPSSVAQVII
ncbi:hypothetical protein AAVH_15706 [Aphelenchoides avenae]|nr:hypothetical protein AAVH_15706 [Aphelenchus avenae]